MRLFQPDLTCEKYESKFLIPEGLVAHIVKAVETQNFQTTVNASQYLEDFIFMVMNYHLRPLFQIQFQRKYYHSKEESGVSVMFDKDLFYKKTCEWKLEAVVDQTGAFSHLNDSKNIVLKFYWKAQLPSWMKEIISSYDLQEVEFSNYNFAQDKLSSLNSNAVTIL